MNLDDKIELIVACGLTGFLLFWYVLFFWMLARNSDTQIIKSKSPRLLLMSIAGNFLSFLALAATLILATLQNASLFTQNSIKGIANTGIILTEAIFAPLMFYSHMFRMLQLKNIFEIADDVGENTLTKSKWFRQGVYFIFNWILLAVTTLLACWLIYHYTTAEIIFPDSLTTILMSLSFIFIFAVSVFGVTLISSVKYFTEVRAELTSLVTIWTAFNAVFNYLVICFDADMNRRLHTVSIPLIVLLVRNMVSFIVVLVIPLLDRKKEKVIPFGETQASVSGLEMILASEMCFKCFFDFIAILDKDNGANITALYIQMRLYEEIINDKVNMVKGREMIQGIMHDFLTKGGRHWINDIPAEVKKDMEERLGDSGLDARLIGGLYNYVLPRLQKYFEAFKNADLYAKLQKELKHNEIVYERLVNGNLI